MELRSGDLTATWLPELGMIGSSLRWRGRELLGMRKGLQAYRETGSTCGIPFLAPWANRLRQDLPDVPGLHHDAHGLPIHGLLAASPDWSVEGASDDELVARLVWNSASPGYEAWPHPHEYEIAVRLAPTELVVRTTLVAKAEGVPVAFGWHPYFVLPDAPRSRWRLDAEFGAHVELDEEFLPTGRLAWLDSSISGPLGVPGEYGKVFDDLFTEFVPGTTVWLHSDAAPVRIGFTYGEGYPWAVLYAPANAELVAIEPMTAPTNPLPPQPFEDRLVVLDDGQSHVATFTVIVEPNDERSQQPVETGEAS